MKGEKFDLKNHDTPTLSGCTHTMAHYLPRVSPRLFLAFMEVVFGALKAKPEAAGVQF